MARKIRPIGEPLRDKFGNQLNTGDIVVFSIGVKEGLEYGRIEQITMSDRLKIRVERLGEHKFMIYYRGTHQVMKLDPRYITLSE